MHLPFQVLDLELLHRPLRQLFMPAIVPYASSVQSLGFGAISHAYPSNDFYTHLLLKVLRFELFHTPLAQILRVASVSNASSVQRLGLRAVSHTYLSNVYAGKIFTRIFC